MMMMMMIQGEEKPLKPKVDIKNVNLDDGSIDDIMAMMGLPVDFDSTKGKKVENEQGAMKVTPVFHYRQYMNRKGLFSSYLLHHLKYIYTNR